MEPLPLEELVARFGSRYDLVIAAARRAEQLKDGAPPLLDTDARNPLSIALEELAAGKILLGPAPEGAGDAPVPRIQDYLSRRGSLQEHLGGFIDITEDEEEEFEGDEEFEEGFDEDFEADEGPVAALFIDDEETDFDLTVDDDDEDVLEDEEADDLADEVDEDFVAEVQEADDVE